MFVKGFTLIELMIAIVIIGILYAIALPAYTGFVQDGRRADVQQTMLQYVAILEREYTRLGGYPDIKGSNIADTEYYTFTYTASSYAVSTSNNNDSTTFIIAATPLASSSQADDPCQTLTINEIGTKLPDQSGCWGK